MKNLLKINILLVFLFLSVCASAQISHTIVAKSGWSNSHGFNRTHYYDEDGRICGDDHPFIDGNKYEYGAMYSIEASIIEPLVNKKISLEQGIGIESKSFYMVYPDPNSIEWIDNPTSSVITISRFDEIRYKETYRAITIPIKVRYQLNNTFSAFGGVSNIIKLKNLKHYRTDRKYNLRGVLGFDAVLFKNFIIGCEYGYDITRYSKMDDDDIFYRFDVIAFKIGMKF